MNALNEPKAGATVRAEATAMISVQGVSKAFGRVSAVNDVSLDIRSGEFFSLLGASGSGKTTLLRMIAGFEPVTTGRILIDGTEMQDMPPHLRPINMVFQNYAIFPHLNVRDNISYGLRRLRLQRAEQHRMVDAMLDLIALSGYGDRRANQLSGGQQQRVALARALVLKPKVLLLDEPLGALDKNLREQMQLELRGLQQRLGITFLLVTHDQEEAFTLSDRVAVMADGRVLQIGTPADLYDRPRNRRVAGFVGTMNFFDATVRGATVLINALGSFARPPDGPAHNDDSRVLVAIRPEGFAVHAAPPGIPAVEGRIVARQYLGGRQHLHVQVPNRSAPVAVATASTRGGDPWAGAEGRTVWLSTSSDAIILLDPE